MRVNEHQIKKSFSSKGRMKRKEFAFFHFFYILISGVGLIPMYIATVISIPFLPVILFAIGLIIILLVNIMYITSTIKRLHDLNHNGYFILIHLIPWVNLVFWLYLLFRKSVDENNRY